jgi:hypothetical protein
MRDCYLSIAASVTTLRSMGLASATKTNFL